jgi:hypothetical protein
MNSIVLWIILTIIYSIFKSWVFLINKMMKKTDKNKKKFWEKNDNFWKKKLSFFLNEFDSFMNHINCFLLYFTSWVFLIENDEKNW